MRAIRAAAVLLAWIVAACAARPPATPASAEAPRVFSESSADFVQVPPFSRLGWAPFARADAVAIAVREWRLWGSLVDDDPPGTRPPNPPDQKPERLPGLWERVGEYWWTAMRPDTRFASWTGKHDSSGVEFASDEDGHYAWSAGFISYVMRVAGAGDHFPYSAAHADYINAARQQSMGVLTGVALSAERPDGYAPQPGDLICLGRGRSRGLTFDDLPVESFPGHCDIVVAAASGQLSVIGGNVDDAVTEKHVPTTADGMLSPPGGPPMDARYPWFVVLRVLYAQ